MDKALWVRHETIQDRAAIDDLMADATVRGIRDVIARLPNGALADHLVRAGAAVGVRVHAWLADEDPAAVLAAHRVDGLHCDDAEGALRAARAADRPGIARAGVVVSTGALPTSELAGRIDLFCPHVSFSDHPDINTLIRELRAVRNAAGPTPVWAGGRATAVAAVGALVRAAAESGCAGVILDSYDAARPDLLDALALA